MGLGPRVGSGINRAAVRLSAPDYGSRFFVFVVEVIYLVVLAWLAWAYLSDRRPEWLRLVPGTLGSVPTAVVWFGALGGVLISLAGVHAHRYTWDPRYWSWHVVRPFVGGAVGLVAVMIIQAGILATGEKVATTTGEAQNTFYYLVAFIVGYREAAFRTLLRRLGDAILTSEEDGINPVILDVQPNQGDAKGGTPVTILGTGLAKVELVRFGSTEAPEVIIASDGEVRAVTPAGTAGETVDVTVVTQSRSTSAIGKYTFL